jgi:hypothetical protein
MIVQRKAKVVAKTLSTHTDAVAGGWTRLAMKL